MIKTFFNSHRSMKALLLIGIMAFLSLHILVSFGVIPYENLWGTSVTGQVSLVRAEGFALFFIIIFIIGIFLESSKISNIKLVGRGIMWFLALYMALNVLGYLRCDSLRLKIGMSLFCGVLTLLTVWVILLGIKKQRRKPKRKTKSKQ